MVMYAPYYEGDRVMDMNSGRKGAVYADYDMNWQTAGVEFDDEKGVVIHILKSDLLYLDVESRAPHIREEGHGDVSIVPWAVRLGGIDVHRLGDGSMQLNIHNRDDDKIAEVKASASDMQEFALRILQQTTYVLQDKEK
jgi:hypothetical protein